MKNIVYGLLLLCSFTFILACTKSNNTKSDVSAINIVNAIQDVPSMFVYFSFTDSNYYLQQNPLSYASSIVYGASSGVNHLSIVSSADTTKPLIQTEVTLHSGKIYSLFLAGVSTKVDTLLLEDVIPLYSDSSVGIRFLNLLSDNKHISVNLQANSVQSEVNDLAYKQTSDFKSYAANSSIGGVYNFEIHDKDSDSLLATFPWSFSLKKNNTVVISGSESTSINVFSINNY